MKRGSILLTVIIILLVVSAIGTGIFLAFKGYRDRAEYTWQLLEATYRASNALNLSIAFLEKYFSGLIGIKIPTWLSGSVEWFPDFEKRVFAQTDGVAWRNTFALVDKTRHYDLRLERNFSEEINKNELGDVNVAAFPFQNPHHLLLVARAKVGRAVVYKYAILSTNFLNKYAYFTEKETMIKDGTEEPIYFITQDTIDGPFRSNDSIRVSGNPLFKGIVEFAGIIVKTGTGPIYGNPPPRYLTRKDIEEYNITKIKESYFLQLERLVMRVSDAVKSNVPTGLRLPRIFQEEKWEGGKKVLYRKVVDYIVSFKEPVGIDSESAEILRVTLSESKIYRSEDDGKTWIDVTENLKKQERQLFSLKPKRGDLYHLVVHGEEAREILGLDRNEYDLNFNGVIFAEGNVYLKSSGGAGKPTLVDGRFTVVSGYKVIFDERDKTFKENIAYLGDVFIESPIIYADYVEVLKRIAKDQKLGGSFEEVVERVVIGKEYTELLKTHESDDFLNIVAANDIILAAEDKTSRKKEENVKIFASLYAFDGSFHVKDYDKGSPAGELLIFGSLMQYRRGAVGTFRWDPDKGESVIQTGYYKNYIYDWRILKGLAAPGTPAIGDNVLILIVREVH